MPVFLDGHPIRPDATKLGAVLDEIRSHVAGQGRVIVEVELNEERLIGEAIHTYRDADVQQGDLKLTSAEPNELILQAIEDCRIELQTMAGQLEDAAQMLQQDRADEAFPKLQDMLQTWQRVQQVVRESSRMLGFDLDAFEFEGRPVTELFDGLVEQLKDLRDQVQSGDALALADTLAYEWPETVARWQQMLSAYAEALNETGPPQSG